MIDYLLVTFCIVSLIQSFYYLLFLTPLLGYKQNNNKNSEPISVVVCAKNEAQNLKTFIPKILKQDYPSGFEIVIINDRSTDTTAEVLSLLAEANSNIKIVNIEDCEHFWGNKKYALTLGIKAATHQQLLFIDADCFPASDNWIQEMASKFSIDKTLVLGYGAYQKEPGSWLNKLIRYETLMTAIQYFSYAKIGIPYMGVGRNLAYMKSEFYKVKGFIKHMHIKSGDDDLFINQVATSQNTTYNINRKSFTISPPKSSYKAWIRQKRRHISTASQYKFHHKFLLALFYLSQLSFFLIALVLLVNNEHLKEVFVLMAIRYSAQLISLGIFSKKLDEKDLILYMPFLELFLIFFQLYIYLKNKTSSPVQWQ